MLCKLVSKKIFVTEILYNVIIFILQNHIMEVSLRLIIFSLMENHVKQGDDCRVNNLVEKKKGSRKRLTSLRTGLKNHEKMKRC